MFDYIVTDGAVKAAGKALVKIGAHGRARRARDA
jgi:hypothetical protein